MAIRPSWHSAAHGLSLVEQGCEYPIIHSVKKYNNFGKMPPGPTSSRKELYPSDQPSALVSSDPAAKRRVGGEADQEDSPVAA